MSVAVSQKAILKSLQSLKGAEHVRSRSSSPARPAQVLSPNACPSSPSRDASGFGLSRSRSGRGTPSPDPMRESPSSGFRTDDAHADAFMSRLHSTASPAHHTHLPADLAHHPLHPLHPHSILDDGLPPRSASVSSTLSKHISHPGTPPVLETLLASQLRHASSPCFPTPCAPLLSPLDPTPTPATAAEQEDAEHSSSNNSSSNSLLDDLTALESDPASAPAPWGHHLGATQKHLLKLLTRAGADSLKVAQMLQSPLDGLANIAADSGSEMLLKRVAAAAALAPGPAGPAIEYNPVHARVLSVLLSALLSGASAQSLGAMDLPALAALQPGGGGAAAELGRSFVAEAGRLAPVAAMAPAPALKAGDAEEAIGASTLAASAGFRTLMRAGSDAKKALPDLSNILDGVLGSVHDSIDEGDHAPIPSAQLLQQHGVFGHHGAGHASVGGAGL